MIWLVTIREIETDIVVAAMPCESETEAIKVTEGAAINLNHEKYYVMIEQSL